MCRVPIVAVKYPDCLLARVGKGFEKSNEATLVIELRLRSVLFRVPHAAEVSEANSP